MHEGRPAGNDVYLHPRQSQPYAEPVSGERSLTLLTWPLYVLCAGLAAIYAPSWRVVVLYGLPTWAGGALFTLLMQQALRWRRTQTDTDTGGPPC